MVFEPIGFLGKFFLFGPFYKRKSKPVLPLIVTRFYYAVSILNPNYVESVLDMTEIWIHFFRPLYYDVELDEMHFQCQ